MTSSTTPGKTIVALLMACGLLTVSVAALLWVNSRRLSHYNDEINDLRRHAARYEGEVQQLSRRLDDCLYLKKAPDNTRRPPLRTEGWD